MKNYCVLSEYTFMWEDGVYIYGTLRVPNNFPQKIRKEKKRKE